MPFRLVINSKSGKFFDGQVEKLNIRTINGYVTILPNHIPLLSPLDIGKFSIVGIQDGNSIKEGSIAGGIISVNSDKVEIITNAIEETEDIDIERAKKALERAKNLLEHKNERINVARAEAAMKRALNRIDVYNSNK